MDSVDFQLAVVGVIGCLLAGLLLLVVEVLFIPGLGLAGVLGAGCLLTAVIWAFAAGGPMWGSLVLLTSIAIVAVMTRLLGHVFGRRLVLDASLEDEEESPEHELVGSEGVALSPLRPSGVARFGLRRMDVISRGEFLERGSRVVVLAERAGHLVVGLADSQSGVES
ncbi:MAG: NfeD family protein [Acidobacteriota bacterium]